MTDIFELEQQLAAETKSKQQFERDWLEGCDRLNDERRIHLELEETLVKKLEAAQAREKGLRAALELIGDSACGEASHQFIALTALAPPTDDTALRAALANDRFRIADWFYREGYLVKARDVPNAIHALGDE